MTERELFIAALRLPEGDARAAFLESACADKPSRERVESMLRDHEQLGSFLESPASPQAATADYRLVSDGPGAVIGPYKLLEAIGEGGMGTVLMAEQIRPVKRLVALKLIKAGMDSRQVLARFEAERQAMALMDHPNIAKVLDAGATDQGRPYFVMELVKGTPITQFCDGRRLSLRERLELFIPACQAVQHAHQKGIIHRDLKPSNVLVGLYDGIPIPKVIDFGVAKAAGQKLTDVTLFTGFGAVVGTPEYMSPEQAQLDNLDIDTRSDVYALGVLLYELLTGTTPLNRRRLKEAAVLEVLRVIREEEPPRPSMRLSTTEELPGIAACRNIEPRRLSSLVRGDLDWIVMKALEKDRNRRYETASDLAADLRRYLHDEPVQAGPPSPRYRFRKFARRNRRALVSAALLGAMSLVAVGAIAGAIGWAVRDRGARQAAMEQEALLALQEAKRLQGQAKYSEALSAAKRAGSLLAGGSSEPLRKRVEEMRDDLVMVLRLEEIRMLAVAPETSTNGIGEAFDYGGTDLEYAKAFRRYGIDIGALRPQEAARRIGSRAIRQELVDALDNWTLCRAIGRGGGDVQRLIAVAQTADPDELRNRLRHLYARPRAEWETLIEQVPAAAKERRLSATSLDLCGHILFAIGKPERALEVLQEAQRRYPGDFWVNFHLGFCHSKVRSQWNEAIRFYSVARGLRPDCAFILKDLAIALQAVGRVDEAVHCSKEAIRLEPDFAEARYALGRLLPGDGLPQALSSQVREQWRREMQRRASTLKILRIERDRPVAVEIAPKRLLAFSSPPPEVREGTLWACGGAGRPILLVAMEFSPWDEGQVGLLYELASLSDRAIQVGGGDGGRRWQRRLPGVSIMHEFNAAPAPAVTASDRLSQMKGLVKRMAAHAIDGLLELRVLPEPIHRYADDAAGIVDGAIFVFAYRGNPEVVLLVEAHHRAHGSPVWHYSLTRMSESSLSVTLDGNEVWKQKPSNGQEPLDGYQSAGEPFLPL